MMMDGMGLGTMVCGLLGIALVLLTVAATVWMVKRVGDSDDRRLKKESPDEMLRRRFAAGELDKDEYADRRASLEN